MTAKPYPTEPTPPNPIHQVDDNVFLVWAETWADIVGAYDTRERAQQALDAYCVALDAESEAQHISAMEQLSAIPQVDIPARYQFDYPEECGHE